MRRFALLIAGLALLAGVAATVSGGATQAQARWVITDLGTLGGTGSTAVAISERGQVIGNSGTESRLVHAFLWQNGTMRDLGTLGGLESNAYDINDRGQVVGEADTATKRYGAQISHAFLWQNGKMRDLGTFGGPDSRAYDINDRGQVVGSANIKAKSAISHAFLWEKGRMRDLGTLGGWSGALAINERGQVIGISATRKKDKNGYLIEHAFLWEKGRMRDLGTLGGPESWVSDISEKGQVVGTADTRARDEYGYPIQHAFLWQNGEMRDLGEFEGKAVNERGQVIGDAPRNHQFRALLWDDGNTRYIVGTRHETVVAGINDYGQVLGSASSGPTCDNPGMAGEVLPRAFVWAKGTLTTLPTLSGGFASPGDHSAINNHAQVVGQSTSGHSTRPSDSCFLPWHAVLWTLKR